MNRLNEILFEDDGHSLRKPLLAHFQDLLRHAKRIFFWLLVCCGITSYYAKELVQLLKIPAERVSAGLTDVASRPEIIITRPFEEIWTYFEVGLYLGAFLALPFIVYEIAAFAGPGLKKSEIKQIKTLTLSVYFVFLFGLYIGYQYILELVLHVVMTYGGGLQSLKWTLSSYINTVIGVILAVAILIELPVVMVYLSHWGWVEPKSWSKGRKIAILVNAVISGILSPPDIMSMFAVMIPMQILYELGIILARLFTAKPKTGKI